MKSQFNLISTALLCLVLGSALANAQDATTKQPVATPTAPPAATAPEVAPKLSFSEQAGLVQVAQELNKANNDLLIYLSEITKNHPGYTIDSRTGLLVKIVPAKTEPEAPKAETKK